MDPQLRQLMREEEKMFGLKQGFQMFTPYPFGSLNQQGSRQGMDDKDFFWIENFLKVGEANLRTVWDQSTAFYTASGKTIVYFFFYNIGANNYVAVFHSDGTATQINTDTQAQTIISSDTGTFYVGGQLPVCGQWGTQYLLIANNFNSNAYWIWDNFTLYESGGLAPQVTITNSGSGYSSAPTVTFFGGQGSGAMATATVTSGAVTAVQITNSGSGYKPGDVVQLQFSGGGSDTGAILTPVMTATTLQHISLLAGGTGYTSGVIVNITGGGGAGAVAVATQSGGVINSITLTSPGAGYTSMPTVSFTDPTGTGAIASVLLTATTVASVTVTNGGTNYPTVPTLTFAGGGASTQATATATLTANAISSVAVNTAGVGYTSVPAIVVQAGVNNSAAATASLMPFGVSGSSIETFQSRVWLPYPNQTGANTTGGQFLVSAPGSITDFATSDGGLVFTSTDSFLRSQYTNIKQSNGYLYPIGDSSVSVISNVQTSGNPPVTTFNYQNTDPQVGTSWRDSLVAYSRTLLFANPFGVFGLYGGAVTKISKKLDTIFDNAVFPAAGGVTPTSAVANIFSIKVYLLNITITDPFDSTTRTILLAWDETDWHVLSQDSQYTFVGTQEVDSNLIAWGTDGTHLYSMFNQASSSLTKKISTKLYGQDRFLVQEEAMGVYAQVQDLSTNGAGVSFATLSVDAEHGVYPVPSIPSFPTTSTPPYYPILSIGSGDVTGVNLGVTLTSTSPDFTLNFLGISYIDVGSVAMASTPIVGQISTE